MSIFGIVLGMLPALVWLVFYLQEDIHPEPKRLLIKTFIFGGLFAFIALAAQLFLDCSLVRNFSGCFAGDREFILIPSMIVIFALVEELFKFLAAYFAIHKSSAFNEPVDAMIYAVVASLGFATVENLGAIGEPGYSGFITDPLEIISLRFIGATLLHTLASALVGYYWAVGIRNLQPWKYITAGLILATALHTAFNYLILEYGRMMLPVLLLMIAGFFILSDFEKLKNKRV